MCGRFAGILRRVWVLRPDGPRGPLVLAPGRQHDVAPAVHRVPAHEALDLELSQPAPEYLERDRLHAGREERREQHGRASVEAPEVIGHAHEVQERHLGLERYTGQALAARDLSAEHAVRQPLTPPQRPPALRSWAPPPAGGGGGGGARPPPPPRGPPRPRGAG